LICQPDVVVMTNVAPVHLESFRSVDQIAQAKAEILEGLRDGGTLLFNGDDERLCSIARRFPGPSLDFGTDRDHRVQVEARTRKSLEGMQVTVRTPTGHFQDRVPLFGKHHLYNIAAAVAVAVTLGLPDGQIQQGIGGLVAMDQRGRIRSMSPAGGVNLTLIDESYNSNPAALRSVLEDFAGWDWQGRKLAVLGDMLELGDSAPEFHRDTGRLLASLPVDLLVTVGSLALHIRDGALEAGMSSPQVFSAAEAGAAATLLSGLVQDGDLVLVKGSRGAGLDRMIRMLEERVA
jgi:UDP-N-acetylmuramoyl-tripeptide--D-alanyl-D-alanine ligase